MVFRDASIGGGKMTIWVNFCRAISRNARLLHPTKLPRRPFAIEAVTAEAAFMPGSGCRTLRSTR